MSRLDPVRVTVHAKGVKVTVRLADQPAAPKPPPLAVKLPDLPTVPDVWRGATYVIRTLLGSGDDNPKLRKSNEAGTPFKTWGLALAPAKESGVQTCPAASPGCRAACLYHQGHARFDGGIAACRVAKTVAWRKHKDWFERRLVHELGAVTRRAEARGLLAAVRLNMTSDIPWESDFPALFWLFRDTSYYDYTKNFPRMMRFAGGELPPNYTLTFSRSETNEDRCRDVLAAGGNVAVVFRTRNFPETYLGHQVIDGDETDLRFLDPAGVVVGLSAKGTAKLDRSGFVVDADRISLPLSV